MVRAVLHRQKLKENAVKLMGGACHLCGYYKCYRALHFHHLNPNEKTFTLSHYAKISTVEFLTELKKCTLLCSNCHYEVESGIAKCKNVSSDMLKLIDEEISKFLTRNKINKKIVICKFCKTEFETWAKKQVYCSASCFGKDKRKITWPSPQELQKLLWQKPTSEIATSLGVSDVAVAKFAKKHGLSKPTRGYWGII